VLAFFTRRQAVQPRLSYENFVKAAPRAHAALLLAFSESEATFLNIALAAIDAWNRLGIALRLAPPALRPPGI
jgi:hypothetical protein